MSQRAESPLRELCRGVMPAPSAEHEHARRERIAGRVLELQRELGRQRTVRRRAAFASALAALLGGALSLLLWLRAPAAPQSEPGVRLIAGHASSGQHGEVALQRGPLALGDALLTTPEAEGAELLLSSETALAVAPASRVKLERRAAAGKFEERVRLVQGRVALQVPKLGSRGKVSVETGDALVEVHGTRFTVRVVPRPPLEPFTEVAVQEGRVRVRGAAGELMLGAGEHWSSRVPPEATGTAQSAVPLVAPAPAVTAPAVAAPAVPERVRARAARARPVPPLAPPSDLAAQNRLLEAAELARKNGLPQLALERLDELIRRHPGSEHAQSARVTRFRLLRELGRVQEARAAAQQYLDLYPRGFARAELAGWLQQP